MKLTKITEDHLKTQLGRAVAKNPNGNILVAAFFKEGVVVPPEIEEWQFPRAVELDFCGKIEAGRLWGEMVSFHSEEGRLIQTSREVGIPIGAIGCLHYYPQAYGF